MPPPRRPNVTNAAKARRRIGLETKAAELRAAGYIVEAPREPTDTASITDQLRTISRQLDAIAKRLDAINATKLEGLTT